ncbi:MAG: hypothetical protein HY951_15675 [Bacteroidia bacterium]|nr:hypothetical protein [Bacteroidia bacterium]
MEKIKIKLDTPEMPDDKILKHKNFDDVYKMVKTGKPFFKSAKFIAGASSAIIITGIVVITLFQNNTKNNTITNITPTDTTDTVVKVTPPINGKDIPWEYYTLSNNNKTDIITQSGTVIHIPKNAFTDSEGNAISSPVKLKYREFRNPVDFFRSGIPMDYDSCKNEYIFESAGMFEIGAEKDGINLLLAKNKAIDIDMLSDNNEGRFNFYTFDTTKGNWDYVGKDKIRPYKKLPLIATELTDSITPKENFPTQSASAILTQDTIKKFKGKIVARIIDNNDDREYQEYIDKNTKIIEPIVPVLATKDKYVFKLDINKEKFPEFAKYSNVLFQVDDRGNKFDKMLYSVRWEQINLKPSRQKGLYNLYLSRKDTSVHLKVIPVFDNKNYQQAMNIYQEEIIKNKTKNEQNLRNKQALFNTQGIVNEMAGKKGFLPSSIRSVSITTLGIFNCDYPLPSFPNVITPQFVDNTGKNIQYKMLYIADKSKNLLGTYAEGEKVKYKKGSENIMWILTWEGKIGIVEPLKFNEITSFGTTQIELTLLEDAEGINKLYKLINI